MLFIAIHTGKPAELSTVQSSGCTLSACSAAAVQTPNKTTVKTERIRARLERGMSLSSREGGASEVAPLGRNSGSLHERHPRFLLQTKQHLESIRGRGED